MKRLLLISCLTVAGCGDVYFGDVYKHSGSWSNQEILMVSVAQRGLEEYFGQDFQKVWNLTHLAFVPQEDVQMMCDNERAIGCHIHRFILVDENLKGIHKCAVILHEYTHAVGDQVFGDRDHDHVIYADIYDRYAGEYCFEHRGEYL